MRSSPSTAEAEPPRDIEDESGSSRPVEPSPARRLLVAVLALVLAAAGSALAVAAFRSGPTRVADESPLPEASLIPALTGEPRITAEIPLLDPEGDDVLGGIAVGAGSAWVSHPRGEAGSIIRIDLATNEVTAEIPLQGAAWRKRIAATDDVVWVASSGVLERIDPTTNTVVASVELPDRSISAITADDAAVWMVTIGDDGGILVRIDPATNEITAEIPLGPEVAGYEDEVVLGSGAVWVLGVRWFEEEDAEYGSDLIRIDPATNTVAARIPVGAFHMVMGEDDVWVRFPADGLFDDSNERWLWTRVDVGTNEPSAPFAFEDDGLRLAAPDALWSVGYDDQEHVRVTRFDPETFEVEARSEPIRSLFTDAVLDPASRTVWVSTVWSVVRLDILPEEEDASALTFPMTYREGEDEVMPIAFLNGTTVEMVYPADLPLEQVTIQPTGSLYDGVSDFSLDGLSSKFVVWRDPVDGMVPVETYDPTHGGIVRKWRAVPADGHGSVRLGPWLVDLPYVRLTDDQHQALLDHLSGLETEGGFLILEATSPLLLWPEGGLVTQMYYDVDNLQILDRCIDFSQASDDSFIRNGIEVFRANEAAAVGVDIWFWCDRTGEFGIQVNEGPLAEALVDGLSFRNARR